MTEKCMKKGCIYDSYWNIRIKEKDYHFCFRHKYHLDDLFKPILEVFVNE